MLIPCKEYTLQKTKKHVIILITKSESCSILVEDKEEECKSRSFFRGSSCPAKNFRFCFLKILVANETKYQGRGKPRSPDIP